MPSQNQGFIPGFARKGGLLSALIAALFARDALAVPAGRVDFSVGPVTATGADGVQRPLSKGVEINSGDSISTGDGRVQIRFTDGAYMSLQPKTVFKVDSYTFAGKPDGSEKGIFSLVAGGLRTISGLIGKGKRENYELHTKTATIGIRGTAYSANQTDDTLVVSVGEGAISVTNQGGSLTIGSGQSAIVRSPLARPEMTNEKALAPKSSDQQTGEQQPPADDAAASGEQRTTTGTATTVAAVTSTPTPTPTPTPTVLVTGSGFAVAHLPSSPDFAGVGPQMTTGASAVFDTGGTLKSYTSGANYMDYTFGGTAAETGSDGLIGWGRWRGTLDGNLTGANNPGNPYVGSEGMHYVAGVPSTLASLNLGSNAVVNYSLVGNTTPSVYYSGATSSGSISGISVNPVKATVTFSATPTMLLGFTVNTSIVNYTMTNFGNISLSLGSTATFTGTGSTNTGCITTCTVSLAGLFSGASAERVGIAYYIYDPSANVQTKGAIAFKTP